MGVQGNWISILQSRPTPGQALVEGIEAAFLGVLCKAAVQLQSEGCRTAGNHGFSGAASAPGLLCLLGRPGAWLPGPGAGSAFAWGQSFEPSQTCPLPTATQKLPCSGQRSSLRGHRCSQCVRMPREFWVLEGPVFLKAWKEALRKEHGFCLITLWTIADV